VNRPASIKRINTTYTKSEIMAFISNVEKISPESR
jgi:hypothetical protein